MGPQFKGHLRQFLVSLQYSHRKHTCELHPLKCTSVITLISPIFIDALRRNLELISPSPDFIGATRFLDFSKTVTENNHFFLIGSGGYCDVTHTNSNLGDPNGFG